jgi:hypothetical protein
MTGCCFSGVNAGLVPMMINISFHKAPRVRALAGAYVFVVAAQKMRNRRAALRRRSNLDFCGKPASELD